MTANTLAEITNLNFAYTIEQLSLTELIKQLPEDRQRFYMFGTPIYNNLGDLAISEAQKRFFVENFPEIAYIEINEPQTEQAIEELLPLLRSDDMIGYVGGGNIGNLHITHEIARRKVFLLLLTIRRSLFRNLSILKKQKKDKQNCAKVRKLIIKIRI
ncbi:hypothetical protein [Tetragenococcus halophilus]|uniref:hypothetical protein n=1 Tax=Tetragenococcus halophilus TaxID=51669 RepID=UPI001B3E1DF1|nr:hypothetical protein [Tetragenococcus halophilus]GLL50703.1 hypothetical protein YA5_006760 [Tetragenococcus halophilus]